MIESENLTTHEAQPQEPASLRELLRERTEAAPDKVFLFSEADGRRYTYAEFDGATDRARRLLAARGVAKADVVGFGWPTGREYIIASFACFKLGAIPAPITSLLKPL